MLLQIALCYKVHGTYPASLAQQANCCSEVNIRLVLCQLKDSDWVALRVAAAAAVVAAVLQVVNGQY
jgi:hypothetical protein